MPRLTEIERSQVITLKDDGKTWAEVLDIMKNKYDCIISKRACQNLVKKHKETGSIKDLPKSGRPRKLDVRTERVIRRICIKNRTWTSNQIRATVAANVSRMTINRILLKYGLKYRIAKKKPLLNPKQRRARYEWAQQFQHWTVKQWRRVCFSDESIFKCFNNSHTIKIRRTSMEAYSPSCIVSTVKHGPQVHIWGIIGPYGAGPIKLVKENLNSLKYQTEILDNPPINSVCNAIQFPRKRGIFQQDKAPAHWSKSTKKYLSDRNVPLLPWPGNSPDLNIIENVWGHIGYKIREYQCTTASDLFAKIQELWYNLGPEYFDKLYKSMPQRVRNVIKNRGGTTKY